MYPRNFEYIAAGSLDEALDALAANPGAKVISGGMSLLPMMKMRLISPATIVDIGRIPGLDQVTEGDGHVSIGALVRHAETATNPLITTHGKALSEAASYTGDMQIRARGTTCGSLAHADIAADQPAGALALGATMVARSKGGTREIPASEFFVDVLTSALNPDEILVEVRLPLSGAGTGSNYDKLGRRGGHSDYAVAGAAAWVSKSNGTVSDARVALTGVGLKPTLAQGSMEAIIGSDGSADAVTAAAGRAAEGVTVLEDLYGSVEYKAHLASVYVGRALTEAINRAG